MWSRTLLISTGLHGAFILLLVGISSLSLQQKETFQKPVAIEVVQKGTPQGGKTRIGKPSFDTVIKGTRKKISEVGNRGIYKGHEENKLGLKSFDLNTENEDHPLLSQVWAKLNGKLGYPNEFVENEVEGEVQIDFLVDRKGVFAGRVFDIKAEDPFLKSYIVFLLSKVLEEAVSERFWRKKEELIRLSANFQFKLLHRYETPKEVQYQFFNRSLQFKRTAFTESKLNKAIDRLFTEYVPPVIILPGFAFIDFFSLYKFVRDKTTLDPRDFKKVRLFEKRNKYERESRGKYYSTR